MIFLSLFFSSEKISAENSLLSLGGHTVHQIEKLSGPPEKLAVHITLITKVVANSHFITEHSRLIVECRRHVKLDVMLTKLMWSEYLVDILGK